MGDVKLAGLLACVMAAVGAPAGGDEGAGEEEQGGERGGDGEGPERGLPEMGGAAGAAGSLAGVDVVGGTPGAVTVWLCAAFMTVALVAAVDAITARYVTRAIVFRPRNGGRPVSARQQIAFGPVLLGTFWTVLLAGWLLAG